MITPPTAPRVQWPHMFDFIFSVGQTASVLLMLYGGFLVAAQWLPARRPLGLELKDELLEY